MRKNRVRSKNVTSSLLLLFIVFAAAIMVDAQEGLSLVEAEPHVPIDPATKAGSTLLQIKNGGPAEVPVSLVFTELKSGITGQLLSAKVTISTQSDASGKPVSPPMVKTGEVLVLKVDVSNVTEAGESTATIYQGGKKLGVLTVVNDRAPFGVRLSSPTPDKAELSLKRGAKATLTLKNDDAVSYPVSWRLLVNGVNYEGKAVILPPKESMPVEIDPPAAWFEPSVDGIFKPHDQDGVLTLSFIPGTGDGRLWPSKSVPLTVHLNYWPDWVRQVFGNGIILLVLVAGGLASLLVNAYLPNRLRSVAAEEKLGSLAGRISCISTKIDSRLRVLIRVERLRARTLLKSRGHFSPDFTDAVAQSNEGIAALTSRIEAAEQLDAERHRFDALRAQLPPTLLCGIDDSLQRAADLLRKSRPSAAEIDLAKTEIAKASDLISKASGVLSGEVKDDEFGKRLDTCLANLKDDLKTTFESTDVYKRFQSQLPGPFVRLDSAPTPSSPRHYTAIDADLAKLSLILDFVRLHEARSQGLQQDLHEVEAKIMTLLIPISWESLRQAQLLVRQVECGIYEKDLRDQLPHGVSIELDRQVVRVNEPIEFSVRFHRPALDRTAAREEWSYAWNFGDGLEERGWSAWHYYPTPERKKLRRFKAFLRSLRPKSRDAGQQKGAEQESDSERKRDAEQKNVAQQKKVADQKNVHVQFLDGDGNPIKDAEGVEIKIPRAVDVLAENPDFFGHRTKVEVARLAIGLLVAVVALVAGAKEQLLKLDVLPGLLAVFIIGFAADTIKNLVTQAPPKQ